MPKPNWSNPPTLKDLKADYDNAKASHDNAITRINRFKEIYNESGDSSLKKIKGRSSYNSKLVRKQMEWVIPNIEEPILSVDSLFSLTPLSVDAIDVARENSDILDYQWNHQVNKTELINKAARKFGIEGTCIVKCGWSVKTEKQTNVVSVPIYAETESEINNIIQRAASTSPELHASIIEKIKSGEKIQIGEREEEITEDVIIENRPRHIVRDNESIIIDPSAKGVYEDIRFIVDIVETDYSTLSQSSSYFNLDYVKDYVTRIGNDTVSEYELAVDKYDDDQFFFSDLPRKKITMYEYWGYWDVNKDGKLVSIVASWVGGKMIRLEENPFPHKRIPYAISQFMPIEDEAWGEPNAELLWQDQTSLSGTVRAMQDITEESSAGQEFIDESLFLDPIQKRNYENGKRTYIRKDSNPKDAIYRKSVEPVPNVLFDMGKLYNDAATRLTGVSDYEQRISDKTNGRNQLPEDGTTNREMSVLRRFSTMIESIGMMTLSMNKEFLLDNQVIASGSEYREVGDTGKLRDDFNVVVKVSTPTVKNKQAARIMDMMQTNAANMSPNIASLHYIKIADLWGFKDLSDALIDDMNKEPTEEEMMMQRLQLEDAEISVRTKKIEMLAKIKEMEHKDAKIEEIMTAIASGNPEAKVLKDRASAELFLSQASKMDAQRQLFEQEFTLIDDGTKREERKEDNEFQHLANLEREDIRTRREQENIRLKEEKKSSKQENLDYIKDGTLHNQSYDPADDVFRNILDRNSLDTDEYKKPKGIDNASIV